MKTWHVATLADPAEALTVTEVSEEPLREGEVRIKMKAAALNFFDILLCQGTYQEKPALPFTLGAEIAGEVIEVMEGSAFRVGDRVAALPTLPEGGLAESVRVKEGKVFSITDSISYEEATSMLITYHTTKYALERCGHLQKGEVLLVHAGAGGVGSAAIQLGKAAGAFVIATAGGTEKTTMCKELGADVVIDYLTEDFVAIVKEHTNGKGANVIFDPVGGDTFDRSRKCIAFAGRILVIGFAGGTIAKAPTNHLLVKNYSVVGVHWGLFAKLFPDAMREEQKALMELYEQGLIKPLIYKEFSFEEVPHALQLLGERKTWGKIVIRK